MSYYAVAKGKSIGIFSTWNDCQEQVKGFKGAVYKKFATQKEAEDFITEKTGKTLSSSQTSTAVKPEDKSAQSVEMGNQLRTGLVKNGQVMSPVQLSRPNPARARITLDVCRELHEARRELVS